jgi:hypothetical protein
MSEIKITIDVSEDLKKLLGLLACSKMEKNEKSKLVSGRDYIVVDNNFYGSDITYSGQKVYTGSRNYFFDLKKLADKELPDGWTLKELHVMQSDTPGEYLDTRTEDPHYSPDGTNCWCRAVVVDADGKEHTAGWVFYDSHSTAANCANNCANYCANSAYYYSDFRSALLAAFV